MNAVLVGISDQSQSRDALSLGAALSRALDAELLVAAALDYSPLPIEQEEYDRARRHHFEHLFETVDAMLGDQPYRAFHLEGDAISALERLVEAEHADLLVIGSTHRGALGRVYPGTVADGLLQGSPVPVVVAPRGYSDRPHAGLGLIGVGFDGGEEAEAALGLAESLAAALDCRLRVIAVAPVDPGIPDGLVPSGESRFRGRLDQGLSSVHEVAAEGVLERGEPAHVLARHGLDLDLLVLGSRGRGPLMRAVAGSVASEVVRRAPCPVVVAPRGSHRGVPADPRGADVTR